MNHGPSPRRPRRLVGRSAVLLGTALAAGAACPAAEGPTYIELDNETVCNVNNEHISKRDVEDRIEPMIMAKLAAYRDRLIGEGRWNTAAQEQYNELYLPEFFKELRQLVKEKLMLQEAKEKKLQADKAEYAKRFEQKRQELKTRHMLGAKGFTENDIHERLKEQMLLEEFQAQLVTALDLPNRRDVEAYYKEHLGEFQRPAGVKLRQIRVDRSRPDGMGRRVAVEGSSKIAEELRREVVESARDFADLAREVTADVEARGRGGLLLGPDKDPYLDLEQNKTLARYVRPLKVGEVSEVFASGDEQSWLFVLLEDKRPPGPRPLDGELYQKIYNQLVQDVVKKREAEWFREALRHSLILDGKPSPRPIPLRFFFPDDPALAAEEAAKTASIAKDGAKTAPPAKDTPKAPNR